MLFLKHGQWAKTSESQMGKIGKRKANWKGMADEMALASISASVACLSFCLFQSTVEPSRAFSTAAHGLVWNS